MWIKKLSKTSIIIVILIGKAKVKAKVKTKKKEIQYFSFICVIHLNTGITWDEGC